MIKKITDDLDQLKRNCALKNRHIIILFVDQLSLKMSSLKDIDKKNDLIVMCETTDYFSLVPHHKIKIAYQLSCMRHFYEQLKKKGFRLDVTTITKKNNSQILHEELSTLITKHNPQKIIFTEPSEWTTNEMIKSLKRKTSIPFECREDDRFFATKKEFATYAESKNKFAWKTFIALQRQKHNILMDNKKPIGGQWNFDASNRKKLPTKSPFLSKHSLSKTQSPRKQFLSRTNYSKITQVTLLT